jgi:hypothetical protein
VTEQDTPEGIIHHAFEPATGYTDIAYGHNTLGELTTTTVNKLNGQTLATPLVTSDTYDPAGNKATETLPNGVVTSWADDDLNRLVSMSEMLGTTTLFSQTFTLNDDGTRASSHQTQLQPDGSTVTTDTTWSNDALGRLTSETLSSSDSSQDYSDQFVYDLVGNRLQSVHTGPGNGADETIDNTYNGDDQPTKEVSALSGETDLAYDPNGSLTTSTPLANPSQASTYGYDVRNKMVSANVNGVSIGYVYDDAGNRVGETTGGVTTFYVTDDNNPTGYAQPIEQKASVIAAPSVTYVIGDRVLAQANSTGAGAAAVSYFLPDGHGSTRALTDHAGAVTQTFNYTVFGGAIGFDPTAAGTTSTKTVFLFGGDAVFDPASGLYLHGDGTRPRDGFFFTQMDSYRGKTENPLSLHKYAYADFNPVTILDPTGHDGLADLMTSAGIYIQQVGARVSAAFAVGAAAVGRFWNVLGQETEEFAQEAIEDALPDDARVLEDVQAVTSKIDFKVVLNNVRAWIEVKYRLPDDGSALTRAINQMNNIGTVAERDDSIIVWALKTPSLSEKVEFLSNARLSPEVASRIHVIGGVDALSTLLKTLFQ